MNQQVRAMVTQEEEEEEMGGQEGEEPLEPEQTEEEMQKEEASSFQLSVYAVQSTSSTKQTFTLSVRLNKSKGTALVDNGSSGTLIVEAVVLSWTLIWQ